MPGPIVPPPLLRVMLCGQIQAEDSEGRSVLPKSRKTRALLALLAVAAPQAIPRTQLMSLLWSKRDPEQARGSLRQSLHELQHCLEPNAVSLLEVDRFKAALRIEGLSVHLSQDQPGEDWTASSAEPMADLIGIDPALDAFLASKRATLKSRAKAENPATAEILPPGSTGFSDSQAIVLSPVPVIGGAERLKRLRVGIAPIRAIGAEARLVAEGLAEELIQALARFRFFSCVLVKSPAALPDDAEQDVLWHKLGIDCILEGTAQASDGRVRINLRLLDLRNCGEVAWVERYDEELVSLLRLQERIAARTVSQLETKLLLWGARMAASLPNSHAAARYLLPSALARIFRLNRAMFEAAGENLEQALRLDPENPNALSWMAQWHLFSIGQGWARDAAEATRRAREMATMAADLSPDDAQALTLLGHVQSFGERRPEQALSVLERAREANPNLPMAWCRSAYANSYAGQHEVAVAQANRARQMSSIHPLSFMFENALAVSLLLQGDYTASVSAGERAIALNPGYSSSYKTQLAALGHLGLRDRAAEMREQLLRLEPGFTVGQAIDRTPIIRGEDRARYADGLRLGGLR